MSKKVDKELMELDLYSILEISVGAGEKEIKKSFRKKALACHPDKNPDNPDAADEFQRLKKILEIFLDPGARNAYDKVLKSRKAAAVRAKESNQKSQKLKADLERREKASEKPQLSETERLRRELKRLEAEGEQLIAEEIENLNREAVSLKAKAFGVSEAKPQKSEPEVGFRIKARWTTSEDSPDGGYTKEQIQTLFYKWGEINAVVVKTKGNKNTALIEFKTQTGADMAVQFEKGLVGKPVEVSRSDKPEEKKEKVTKTGLNQRDFESVASMNKRREIERQKLIDQMMSQELS